MTTLPHQQELSSTLLCFISFYHYLKLSCVFIYLFNYVWLLTLTSRKNVSSRSITFSLLLLTICPALTHLAKRILAEWMEFCIQRQRCKQWFPSFLIIQSEVNKSIFGRYFLKKLGSYRQYPVNNCKLIHQIFKCHTQKARAKQIISKFILCLMRLLKCSKGIKKKRNSSLNKLFRSKLVFCGGCCF